MEQNLPAVLDYSPMTIEVPCSFWSQGNVEHRRTNIGHSKVNFYPYDNDSWTVLIKKYGFKPPTITTIADGVSECKSCKTRYSGRVNVCLNKIRKIETEHKYDTWNSYEVKAGNDNLGDMVGYHKNDKVISVFEEECGKSDIYWDKGSIFESQRRMFDLLNTLATASLSNASPLSEIANLFDDNRYVLEIAILTMKMQELQMHANRVENAIGQIINKMNAAGNNLSW